VKIKPGIFYTETLTAALAAPSNTEELGTELFRKSIHFLIALSPSLAAMNFRATEFLLLGGVLLYTAFESLRISGVRVPLVSDITALAARSRDRGFVLGPVTLGLGAWLSLKLYSPEAAAIAVYALAFGDGVASLAGKFFGRLRPAFLRGKSIEGSLACFIAVFLAAFRVSGSYSLALAAALTATAFEALPIRDFDNIILPAAAGAAVQIFLSF